MKTIIFSKNRACQLDALLRSLDHTAVVIYTHSEDFKNGYDKILNLHKNHKFIKETNLKQDILANLKGEYVMFLCDDDIMIDRITHNGDFIEHFKVFKKCKDIVSFSIRLAPYLKGAPEFQHGINVWEWKGCYRSWGYPMSVTSTIFRIGDILPLIKEGIYDNPVELEVFLRNHIPIKKYMICCNDMKVINNLANHVIPMRYKTSRQDLYLLEHQFLSGKRIDLKDLIEKGKKADYCFMKEGYLYE
jgi:hypothetical protein